MNDTWEALKTPAERSCRTCRHNVSTSFGLIVRCAHAGGTEYCAGFSRFSPHAPQDPLIDLWERRIE